jgi:hypothetical protein
MNKGKFKYIRSECEGSIHYVCDTDFSIYDYKPSLTIFKKGWFRNEPLKYVLMITDILKPENKGRYIYFYFKTLKEVKDYIKPMLK